MILKPFEFIYQLVTSTKNFLYDQKYLKSIKLGKPVISIGNLSFGGTGKTPFIEFMAKELIHEHGKISIICRSYKALSQQPEKVDLNQPDAAKYFGDEATLLQSKLPQCEVWSGPRKYQTALASLQNQPELLLIDDGFSHRKLQREFDIILIDATKLKKDYHRESLNSLKRAQTVVLTKATNPPSPELIQFKFELLQKFPHLNNSIYTAESKISISNVNVKTPLFVFCGIANPDFFKLSLENENYSIVQFLPFADHQVYAEGLQVKIVEQFKELLKTQPQLQIVTTEKDSIKINHPELKQKLNTVNYQFEMNLKDKESLFEKIRANI